MLQKKLWTFLIVENNWTFSLGGGGGHGPAIYDLDSEEHFVLK